MSKIIPREYYICDYCGRKSDFPNFDYTDNSGINNKSYDMCSDECLKKHIDFLRLGSIQSKYFVSRTIEEHIINQITERGFKKIDSSHRIFELIKEEI